MKCNFIEKPKENLSNQQMNELFGGATCGIYHKCPAGETGKNSCSPYSCIFYTSCEVTRNWLTDRAIAEDCVAV
ncbi:MAG: hypothetical protein LBE13_07585 [Bacteroidales bacterium]|jgi:hypothetical protein|nr:hypothetical protein [Bacteroidales bacterium]